VVGFTIGSRDVPGKRKPVIKEQQHDDKYTIVKVL
jgi:hypothetical protein